MEIPGVKQAIDGCYDRLNEITGASPTCPFCEGRDWARLAGGRVTELWNTRQENQPTRDTVTSTTLGFLCTRCGFVRLHYVDPRSWGMPGMARI